MSFRFYTNVMSRASRIAVAWLFTTGLGLAGLGVLIYLLPRLFATLAAVIFFAAGLGLVITSVKIFIAQRRLDKIDTDDSLLYRRNVRIHTEEDIRQFDDDF